MLRRFFSLFFISVFLIWGCGENKQNPENQSDSKEKSEKTGDIESFAENMKNLSENLNKGKKVTPVDFRELKALLPEQIGNLKRTNASGERSSAMGINISKAEADYNDDEYRKSIDVEITDMGNISGLTGFGAFGWYMVDVDKENDEGYERTFNYQGNKAYEKYNNKYQDGEISVLVGKRFVVEVRGNNVSPDELRAALGTIDLGKLESMKDFGVEN